MVKKIILLMMLVSSLVFAKVEHVFPDQKLIDSGIKIIDIRTKGEWQQTGILKGAIPITFFDERGQYDLDAFLKELKTHVKDGEKFAMVCRSGSRTGMVSNYLGSNGYDVVDFRGGILYLTNKLYIKLTPYK